MVKRLIDCNASDFRQVNARDLIEAIRLCEGRVVAAEVLAVAPPLLDKVSNAELAAAMGADLILFNYYDVTAPQVTGFPDQADQSPTGVHNFGYVAWGRGVTLQLVKEWIGRPVGINLEPVENLEVLTTRGRLATAENALAAVEQGADFLVLTGNPATGVTTAGIAKALRQIRVSVGERVILLAGKIHAAGRYEPLVRREDVQAYANAGADGIALPVPGTLPGMTVEAVRNLVDLVHSLGLIVMNGIGTSQEGASQATIEQMALMSKMSGADIHHIGDAGTLGIAIPENIYAWSLALRGRRHTWHRMAASLKR
jgi:hypothetical protein